MRLGNNDSCLKSEAKREEVLNVLTKSGLKEESVEEQRMHGWLDRTGQECGSHN